MIGSLDTSKIYDELLKLNISINYNDVPTPSYVQTLIISCNEYQRKVEKFFIQVTRQLSDSERMLRNEKLNIDTKKRSTLINNERIKRLPTGKEREAAVDDLLEDDYRLYLKLENEASGLKDLLTSIKTVQYNLKSTNSDIKMLVKIMEQQISRLNIGSPEDPEIRGLADNLADLDKMEKEMTPEDIDSVEEYQEEDPEDDLDESVTEILGDASEMDSHVDSEEDSDDAGSDSFLMDDSEDDDTVDDGTDDTEGQPPQEESSSQEESEKSSESSSDTEIDIDIGGDDQTEIDAIGSGDEEGTSDVSDDTEEKKSGTDEKSDTGIDIDELLVSLDD